MDAKFTVLVVDDVEDNRIILRRRFESVAFTVLEADSGEAALKILNEDPSIDLVLLDIQMPGLSGVDTLKEIRTIRPANDLPIIMVTASTAISDVMNARKTGAQDYVTKPIDFNLALTRVKAQLKGRMPRSARVARAG